MSNQQPSSKKSTDSKKEFKDEFEDEWNIEVEESTYERLKEYQQKKGLPTLNSVVIDLLKLTDRDKSN